MGCMLFWFEGISIMVADLIWLYLLGVELLKKKFSGDRFLYR
jgi:hypothetical protein